MKAFNEYKFITACNRLSSSATHSNYLMFMQLILLLLILLQMQFSIRFSVVLKPLITLKFNFFMKYYGLVIDKGISCTSTLFCIIIVIIVIIYS